jgi:hypothetical protein
MKPEYIEAFLYLIQDKLRRDHQISLPHQKMPDSWYHDDYYLKRFNGRDPSVYPRWRNFAMKELLKDPESSENILSVIRKILGNPLRAEIDLVLNEATTKTSSSRNKPGTSKLLDLFAFLDKIFKFKGNSNQNWTETGLYKNIQNVIAGMALKTKNKDSKLFMQVLGNLRLLMST